MSTFQQIKDFVAVSSADPAKLALSVRGLLIAIVPLFMGVIRVYGIEGLDENILVSFIDALTKLVEYLGYTASAIMTAYGLGRKIIKEISNNFI